MKVNLVFKDVKNLLSSHLNLGPLLKTSDEVPQQKTGSFTNLDDLFDANELEEIVSIDVLDYLTISDVEKVILHWMGKLVHGGRLILGGTDTLEVAKAISNRTIDLGLANSLLYGELDETGETKKVVLTIQVLIEFLEKQGFKLMKKRLNNFKYYVEAVRP